VRDLLKAAGVLNAVPFDSEAVFKPDSGLPSLRRRLSYDLGAEGETTCATCIFLVSAETTVSVHFLGLALGLGLRRGVPYSCFGACF
jgi:hypothetical protein